MKLTRKFNSCVKKVAKKLPEGASIAICTKTVLWPRKRTLKRYTRKKLLTQRRGGADPLEALRTEMLKHGCNKEPTEKNAYDCADDLYEEADEVMANHGLNPRSKNDINSAHAIPEYAQAFKKWADLNKAIETAYPI